MSFDDCIPKERLQNVAFGVISRELVVVLKNEACRFSAFWIEESSGTDLNNMPQIV